AALRPLDGGRLLGRIGRRGAFAETTPDARHRVGRGGLLRSGVPDRATIPGVRGSAQGTAPDVFLRLIAQSRKGKLKLYIGHAAGVGKTYQMLEDARALKARGIDVVAGFIETHGRAETTAQIGDLEVIPRRKVEYKGKFLEEMDLPAILARK